MSCHSPSLRKLWIKDKSMNKDTQKFYRWAVMDGMSGIYCPPSEEMGPEAMRIYCDGLKTGRKLYEDDIREKQREADIRRHRRAIMSMSPGHNNATHGRIEQ